MASGRLYRITARANAQAVGHGTGGQMGRDQIHLPQLRPRQTCALANVPRHRGQKRVEDRGSVYGFGGLAGGKSWLRSPAKLCDHRRPPDRLFPNRLCGGGSEKVFCKRNLTAALKDFMIRKAT